MFIQYNVYLVEIPSPFQLISSMNILSDRHGDQRLRDNFILLSTTYVLFACKDKTNYDRFAFLL